MRKYVLDTNIFIRAFRESSANSELQRFHIDFAPFEYLSAVVAQELLAGARSGADRRKLERNVLSIYARRGRLIVPTADAWQKSGVILSELTRREGLDLSRLRKSFGNDILVALSCRESGMVLITDNTHDFARIARVSNFRFIEPWPAPH